MVTEQQAPVFYWHVHHDRLTEALTEPIENRITYILLNKPDSERETRLRLLKPVRGSLPEPLVQSAVEMLRLRDEKNAACNVYLLGEEQRIRIAHRRRFAWSDLLQADPGTERQKGLQARYERISGEYGRIEAEVEAAKARLVEIRDRYYQAERVCHEASASSRAEIEELHKQECPDCPWDGWAIFPER